MATTATIPVGHKDNHSNVTLRKGDKIKLVDGSDAVFMEMKRVRFSVLINGESVSVPLWRRSRRDPMTGEKVGVEPFVTSVVGFDSSHETKVARSSSFSPGDFFTLESKKSLYCFEKESGKYIHAWDVVTKRSFRIPKSFTFVKWTPLACKKEFGVA